MAFSRKAIVFSSLPAASIFIILETLRNRGYQVPLLVCAPGANAKLTIAQEEGFGKLVASYLTDLGPDTPAILAVNSIKQTEASFFATDPDLVFSFGFPYRLTKKLLNHRAKFVNVHTAPVPALRGPFPHAWAILRPDLHPIEDYCVTFHYMTPQFDAGAVIKEINVGVNPEASNSLNGRQLRDQTAAVALSSIDEVLELVESDYEGIPQDPNSKPEHGGGRFLTDEERLVTNTMSAQDIMRLFRAIGDSDWPPMIYFESNLYLVQNVKEINDRFALESFIASPERSGFRLRYPCPGGPLDITIRKL